MGRLESLARGTPTGTNLQFVHIADPAAGQPFSITPPAGRMWEVLSVSTFLTAQSEDQNRVPQLALTLDTTVAWLINATGLVPASGAVLVSFIADYSYNTPPADNSGIATSMPRTLLQPGYSLFVNATGLQSDDQFSMTVVQVLEVSTGMREAERANAERFAERLASFLDLSREDY